MSEKKYATPAQRKRRALAVAAAAGIAFYFIFREPGSFLIPILLSLGGAVFGYMTVFFFIPEPPDRSGEEIAPGVTNAKFDIFMGRCRSALTGLEEVVSAEAFGDSYAMASELMKVMLNILKNCTEDPKDVLRFPLLPEYYERVEKMLTEYARMSKYTQSSKTQARLDVVKAKLPELVAEFKTKLEQMHQDNLMDLDINTSTLDTLLKG